MEQDKRGTRSFNRSCFKLTVLANVDQSLQFEVGDQLDLCAAGTQTPRAYGSAGHGLYVIAVNRNTGSYHRFYTKSSNSFSCKILQDATNGIPTAALGDGIFVVGDENAKITGISGWLPLRRTFLNTFLRRKSYSGPTRLAGQSLDGTQMSIEEAFIQGTSNVAKQTGGVGRNQITHFFVPYNKFAQLLNSSSSKQYVDVAIGKGAETQISFRGLNS